MHQLTNYNKNLCGFCGLVCGNEPSLVFNSQVGSIPIASVTSSCSYFKKFRYKCAFAPKKPSKNSPCTNCPIKCDIANCNKIIWSYNYHIHIQAAHNFISERKYPDDTERDAVLKLRV